MPTDISGINGIKPHEFRAFGQSTTRMEEDCCKGDSRLATICVAMLPKTGSFVTWFWELQAADVFVSDNRRYANQSVFV